MRNHLPSIGRGPAALVSGVLTCIALLSCGPVLGAGEGASAASVDDAAPAAFVQLDIALPAIDGRPYPLRFPAQGPLRVLCFLGCDCPVANLYLQRLGDLAGRFADSGVEFLGINSNPQDGIEKMAVHAAEHGIGFPMLKDHDGAVAGAVGATRTPEVFVIDAAGRVRYQGRVDDQYRPGVVGDSPGRDDLRLAIQELLGGRAVSVPKTTAAGCLIAKRRPVDPDADVSFANQVSRVLGQHCTECHRSGQIGPFALVDYDEVVGWADMMLEVIDQRRMPPWHAADGHAPLANARRMPRSDVELLRRWVEAGTPFGDAADLPPGPPDASPGQLAAAPDAVLPMSQRAFTIPASGAVDYQYFVVDPGFTEDRWIKSAEVTPGNRAVVHHAIVFVRPPDGVSLDGLGWLTAYVPGQRLPPPSGHRARRVPAGSKLVFQMHYTPTGKVQQDLSTLGLMFADPAEVTEELLTLVGINQALEIPPREPAVVVDGSTPRLPADSLLLAMSPHMHLRGKAFEVRARRGESSEVLLSVPRYDFNWQHTYILQTPLPLSGVDSLDFTATFDNSVDNPFNPDADEFVTWGDQTWEEMALVFYEVARPLDARAAPAQRRAVPERRRGREPRIESLVDAFFRDLDGDGDGLIRYEEVDRAVQLRLFHQIDANGDRVLDRREVLDYLRRSR